MFITFEGIDGSGKTTQSKLLANHFKQIHGENNVVLTREPGGTNFAEKIRGVLLTNNIDPISELLLLISMRREHMKKLILPALAEGKIVICDRFIDSTIAYQGYGLSVDLGLIRDLHKLVEIKCPDITFILDIDVKVGLNRAKDKNKYEEMDVNFYNKVRKGFQEI
ncbi:MAG: dTMP kinase, partial [Wolbachia endosymbiont of Andrena labialis]|nr:dTMP kinase [Wolbachia endosymbiont of Andrena labialis]